MFFFPHRGTYLSAFLLLILVLINLWIPEFATNNTCSHSRFGRPLYSFSLGPSLAYL